MKLELESPYAEKWRLGYVVFCPDQRRRVFLYNSETERATLSYARYLMSVKLGRFLEPTEHVDHIDENRTNDEIGNLQILTPEENYAKHKAWRESNGLAAFQVILECPVCEEAFTKRSRVVQQRFEQGKMITCSKRCSAKHLLSLGVITLTNGSNKIKVNPCDHSMIVELRNEGKSDYVISDMLGISRPKIQRYRREMGIE